MRGSEETSPHMFKLCLSLVAYICDAGTGPAVTSSGGIHRRIRRSGMQGTVGNPLVTLKIGQYSNLEKYSESSVICSIGMYSVGASVEG